MTSRHHVITAALLLAFCMMGCATSPDWPEAISYERLDLSDRSELMTQSYTIPPRELHDQLGDPEQTLTRQYPIQGPTGHGSFMGTTVYYVVADDQFYFHSDCGQGHYDGYVGPFDGDPRVVLRP